MADLKSLQGPVYSMDRKLYYVVNVVVGIIWACDWSADSKYFVTVGRDKKCVIWSLEDKKSICQEIFTYLLFQLTPSPCYATFCHSDTFVPTFQTFVIPWIKQNMT